MRTNILFIAPPSVSRMNIIPPKDGGVFSSKLTKEMPLGLVSLATYVKHNSSVEHVRIIDFNVLLYDAVREQSFSSLDEIDNVIHTILMQYKDENFDMACIAAIFCPAYSWLDVLCRSLKGIFPDILTICGGGVPTAMPEETFLASPLLDCLVFGEGEIWGCTRHSPSWLKKI